MIGAAAAEEALRVGKAQADPFLADPLGYFISTSRKAGVVLLLAGTGAGVAAYYMKASATAAMNNEITVISNLGTLFSNIRAPTFQPASTGTAPLSASVRGVQNFFSDAWADVQAAGSDVAQTGALLGTLGEDLAVGVVDLAKSFLGFVMHFPDIMWNGMVWGVGGAVADVLTWVFPWLLIAGGALIVASLVAWGARAIWEITGERLIPRLKLSVNARSARRWNAFDRKWHTRTKIQEVWTQKSTEGMIHSANANPRFEPPEVRPPSNNRLERIGRDAPPKGSRGPKPAIVGQKADAVKAPGSPPATSEGPTTPPEPESPAPAAAPAPMKHYSQGGIYEDPSGASDYYGAGKELPEGAWLVKTDEDLRDRDAKDAGASEAIPGGTPTAEVEQQLGEPPAIEPTAEELREMERNRLASMPEAQAELEKHLVEDLPTADREMIEANREQLEQAHTASEAEDIVQQKAVVIEEAKKIRSEAKRREKVLGRKGFSKRQHRGALEGMNAGMNPDQYGD